MDPVRIMVVDDQADVRFLIGVIVGDAEGLEVVAEADGADAAVARVPEASPDLVLVDARMPAVDGYELTGRLKALPDPPRVAILTSIVDDVINRKALAAGADVCWSKADLEALPALIRDLV